MTSKKVCLNVWRNAHAVVTAVQGEIAARWIEVSLYDHDKRLDISEKTAAIYMTKPDKTIVYNTCEILDAKNGLISVELTSQMSAVAGTICDCEIHIIDKNGSLLKILGLTIIIDRSLEDDKAIESSNEFTLLLKALKEADGLIDTVTEVLNEKLNEFDDAFDALSQQMQSQMKDWLAVKDEEILHKMQSGQWRRTITASSNRGSNCCTSSSQSSKYSSGQSKSSCGTNGASSRRIGRRGNF